MSFKPVALRREPPGGGSGCRFRRLWLLEHSQGAPAAPAVPAAAPVAPPVNTYTTKFPLKEDPISEGGRWMDAKTVGLDWGNISTTPGLAIGHAGPKRFADATALLTGTWGPTQTAEAVVSSKKVFRYPEVSLRLRSDLSPHNCSGYEISNSLKSDETAYLIIVRWNGPLADFTYLRNFMANNMELRPVTSLRRLSSETLSRPTRTASS